MSLGPVCIEAQIIFFDLSLIVAVRHLAVWVQIHRPRKKVTQ